MSIDEQQLGKITVIYIRQRPDSLIYKGLLQIIKKKIINLIGNSTRM